MVDQANNTQPSYVDGWTLSQTTLVCGQKYNIQPSQLKGIQEIQCRIQLFMACAILKTFERSVMTQVPINRKMHLHSFDFLR